MVENNDQESHCEYHLRHFELNLIILLFSNLVNAVDNCLGINFVSISNVQSVDNILHLLFIFLLVRIIYIV